MVSWRGSLVASLVVLGFMLGLVRVAPRLSTRAFAPRSAVLTFRMLRQVMDVQRGSVDLEQMPSCATLPRKFCL
eukprot:3563668-Rhodomonas_salina.3